MMHLWRWLVDGGYTMAALCVVSTVLCFLVLERLLATGAQIRSVRAGGAAPPGRSAADWAGLRRMGLIRACIVVAPLLGLLGTVAGIIQTFEGILCGGYVTEMSRGIHKALHSTQYGLAVAAAGLLAEQVLLRRVRKLTCLRRAAGGGAGAEEDG